jgi:adenine-specific DNA methylase/SAM-dependent methyltransferase
MRPQSKSAAVLAFHADLLTVDSRFASILRVKRVGELCISYLDMAEVPNLPNGYESRRYLDRFCVVLPIEPGAERQVVLKAFFAWLGPEYEAAIDVPRNLENIYNLFGLMSPPLQGERMLDFGCGTGLAQRVAVQLGIELVGVDICEVMQRLAARKGELVITPEALADAPAFDGIIASYVLHLKPEPRYIEVAWSRLKPGGAWVANFHKGEGLNEFLAIMADVEASITIQDNPVHGPYAICVKNAGRVGTLVTFDEAVEYCEKIGVADASSLLDKLAKYYFLPTYAAKDGRRFLFSDLRAVVPLCTFRQSQGARWDRPSLFEVMGADRLHIGEHTSVDLPSPEVSIAYQAGLRKLVARIRNGRRNSKRLEPLDCEYYSPTRITTDLDAVLAEVAAQLQRERETSESRSSEFAHSADYMGSKRGLVPFLVEALTGIVPPDVTVIDLMSGSGSVAGACARYFPVIASDAQEFSRCLAVVQGGGFSRAAAEETLEVVLTSARRHATDLSERITSYLEKEDAIFHGDITSELAGRYAEFVAEFPIMGSGFTGDGWDPEVEVAKRQVDPEVYPYALFTTYFANVYFGLRQCVQIDSLRFGIDQLPNELERTWALGALIATTSKIGTTYAGHFAQPKVRNWATLSLSTLREVIEQRTKSVFHEFAVRLLNLADESSKTAHAIKVVDGPWLNALQMCAANLKGARAVVYLDPPYRREEYSRYYHALETLTTYRYPSITGGGRVPLKTTGERFSSEFFTRNQRAKVEALLKVINEVLDRGWTCAWSYADVADVSIAEVIGDLSERREVKIWSLCTPYRHQTHRGHGLRNVVEYLVVIQPQDWGSVG